jgi:hypothetical protein
VKLRLQGNSIRVRVNQTETAALGAGKPVGQATRFPGGAQLSVSVETTAGAASAATFHGAHLTITVPRAQAHKWASTQEVSLQSDVPLDGGEFLVLLIEKDFECLHYPEKDADAFPNPRAQNVRSSKST